MNGASLLGIIVGITAVIGGFALEGGAVASLAQPAAAAIVFGGTFGATLLSFSIKDIANAISALREVFTNSESETIKKLTKEIVKYSNISRRSGIIALERELPNINNSFLRNSLKLAIDGMSPKMLRATLQDDIMVYEEEKRKTAKVFETAGGYAPTIGIIGAVLGLIHLMQNLTDPNKLGTGIAVAFVATVYGVGSANLILLPLSKKIINRLKNEILVREMIIEAVLGIQAGINAHYLAERLKVFVEKKK